MTRGVRPPRHIPKPINAAVPVASMVSNQPGSSLAADAAVSSSRMTFPVTVVSRGAGGGVGGDVAGIGGAGICATLACSDVAAKVGEEPVAGAVGPTGAVVPDVARRMDCA